MPKIVAKSPIWGPAFALDTFETSIAGFISDYK